MRLDGVLAALIAAYDDDGAISLERQASLIEHILGQGVDGVFVSGSTGEAYLQSVEERQESIAAAVGQVAGRGPVIAHTGSLDTRTTIRLTEHAVAAGADAICAITPIYYHYDEDQHERYFREVAAAAGATPVIAYHIPGRTHTQLPPRFFLRLAHEGVLQGLKYTATDLYSLTEVVRQAPPDFLVYNGSDEVLLGGLALGAHGGIGSTYNAIGSVYVRIKAHAAAGDLVSARREQAVANRFIDEMNNYDFLVFLREVLRRDGVETGHGRSPLPTVTEDERRAINEFLALSVPYHEESYR